MPAIPSEEEWLEQTAKARAEAEAELDAVESSPKDAPIHPILQLQGPFEESISESTAEMHNDWQVDMDAQTRRDQVLTAPKYERLCGRRWKQRPSERYHPLWKLVAQIAFGLHLLARDLAISEAAVIKILQVHIAELDGFIENTTDDLCLAFSDIEERLDHLRLPLGNISLFNDMLADPTFRQTVILDHERIAHIINRTAIFMDDTVKDIAKGKQAVRILGYYTKGLRMDRDDQPHGLDAVYDAMMGNVDGWKREFKLLKRKAYDLALSLDALNQVAVKIRQLAEAASMDSMKIMVSSRPASRDHRRRKQSTISQHKPLPVELDAYTAEAQAIPIVAGRSPATLVQTNASRQERRRGSSPNGSYQHKQYSTKETDTSNTTSRFYTNPDPNSFMTPRRSEIAPELVHPVTNERSSNKRPKTSSSKDPGHHAASEKESAKPFSKFGSRLSRLHRTTSRIFSISAFSNNKSTVKRRNKSEASQREMFDPIERPWADMNSHNDPQMSWSHDAKDPSNINTSVSRKNTIPELPHLLLMSFLDDKSMSDEEEDTSPQGDRPRQGQSNGHESPVTALPIVADGCQEGGMAAEVASTYSTRNRMFRSRNIPVPSLSKPKIKEPFELGANNGHVIYQNRQRLRQKPSILSFISSKKGPKTASNSPAVKSPAVRSRQNSSTSAKQQMPTTSASTSNRLYELAETAPVFNSPWPTHEKLPTENQDTPPVSPKTLSNPMSSSLTVTTDASNGSETIQTNARGSVTNPNTKKPSPLNRRNTDEPKTAATSSTTAKEKPQHGGLSLFPRTPTTPNVRKFVSMTSLRDEAAAERAGNSIRPPRSRG